VHADALTELVAAAPRARVYSQSARAGLADCAPSGRMRLDALARWLQDVAYADVEDAGLAELAVWVVRRSRMRVTRFPRFGEYYTLATFCSGLGRMWAERRTTISRVGESESQVEAVSLWVHLDRSTWRPAPFSKREIAIYGDAGAGRRVTARLRHRAPGSSEDRVAWTFRATERDIAGHINNAAFWQPLEEELLSGDEEPHSIDAEIEYRAPAQPGEKLVLRDGHRRWIVSDEGETHASIVVVDG
jgi:acyl-ACP thioesterase